MGTSDQIVCDCEHAGEVLDVDAYTGGYNLQIAFCTAQSFANHLE